MLVEFINQARAAGYDHHRSLIEAGRVPATAVATVATARAASDFAAAVEDLVEGIRRYQALAPFEQLIRPGCANTVFDSGCQGPVFALQLP